MSIREINQGGRSTFSNVWGSLLSLLLLSNLKDVPTKIERSLISSSVFGTLIISYNDQTSFLS